MYIPITDNLNIIEVIIIIIKKTINVISILDEIS